MEVIYKYTLEQERVQTLSLPADAEILDIQLQNQQVCAWVKLDTDKPERDRKIAVFGTGNPIEPKPMKYISTVQINGFVWHFFEVL